MLTREVALMAEDLFTREDAWGGGYYELYMEYPSATDQDILNVLFRMWSHPSLHGCYLERDKRVDQQKRLTQEQMSAPTVFLGHVLGMIDLPNGERTTCSSIVIRELPTDEGGVTNWILLLIPLGALGYSYSVGGFPFDSHHHLEWRIEVDEGLKEIAEFVYTREKFALGLIGHECMDMSCYKEFLRGKEPEDRYCAWLKPSGAELLYFPATQ